MTDSPEDLRRIAEEHGINADEHCCLQMAARIGLGRAARPDLPVVVWLPYWNEYLIPVAGGLSLSQRGHWNREPMDYCPWCGARLPRSLRDDWYRRLYALGYDDPGEQDVPEIFNSDGWWRS